MPTSKKRKRKNGAVSRRRRPDRDSEFVLACPVWEYRTIAAQLADNDPELTADQALAILRASPIRLWNSAGTHIDEVHPSEIAAVVGSGDDWLTTLEAIHIGGFISWDESSQAHYLSMPAT